MQNPETTDLMTRLKTEYSTLTADSTKKEQAEQEYSLAQRNIDKKTALALTIGFTGWLTALGGAGINLCGYKRGLKRNEERSKGISRGLETF